MRYADTVTFFWPNAAEYDTGLGEWLEDAGTRKLGCEAHVTTPSLALAAYSISTSSRVGTLPGAAKVDQIIVHLKTPIDLTFDHMEWRGRSYFFVSESSKGSHQVLLMRGDSDGLNPRD